MSHPLRQRFAALDGAVIPGGCDHCDAEQRPWLDAYGICHITISHDDWCPWYRVTHTPINPGGTT